MNPTSPVLSQRTNRWMRCFSVLLAAFIAASCSWFGSKAPRPPSAIKGALVAMMIASSINDKGQLVNPRFTFPRDEKQITAVVQLGKTTVSTLTVAWYQKSDEGEDKKLFEQQIQVKSNDLAFSTGKNPGPLLLVGSYKVVATIGGETKEVEFDIAPPKTASNKTSSRWGDDRSENQVQLEANRNDFPVRSDAVVALSADRITLADAEPLMQKVSGEAPSQGGALSPSASMFDPLFPGSSGTVKSPNDRFRLEGGENQECWFIVSASGGKLDLDADDVEISSGGYCTICCDTVAVYATVEGPPREVGRYDLQGIAYGQAIPDNQYFKVDPCWLPGGSDLPDTTVSLKAKIITSTEFQAWWVAKLGSDTLAPRVHVVSTPKRGSKVRPGDKIKLEVDATELRNGGPWQTGVKIIQVTALPGGQVGEPWVNSASPLSQKCAQKTWEQKYEPPPYIVPSNPPPFIKICALAEDYQGNEGNLCGDFVTGDRWQGTLLAQPTASGAYSCTGAWWDIKLDLVVRDGKVEGKASGHLSIPPTCSGPPGTDWNSLEATDVTFNTVKGGFDGREFQLQFGLIHAEGGGRHMQDLMNYSLGDRPGTEQTLRVPVISPSTARGQTSTNVSVPGTGETATGVFNVDLKCTNCK